jgi:hypothetical protein
MLVRIPSPLGHWLADPPAPDGLEQAGDFEDALLFEVRQESTPELDIRFASGFHFREYADTGTYRWMGQQGTLVVVNSTEKRLEVGLALELRSFARPRRIDVVLDGHRVETIKVGGEIRFHPIGRMSLSPGEHALELKARESATVADEVLGNGDERSLTVALWGWRQMQDR